MRAWLLRGTVLLIFSLLSVLPLTSFEEKTVELEKGSHSYVSYFEGEVYRYLADSDEWVEIGEDSTVAEGDVFKVEDDGVLEIVIADSSVVTLGENTQVTFETLEYEPSFFKNKIFLDYGTINNSVEHLTEGSVYEVESPTSVAGVRGTEFDVNYEGEDVSELDVYDGKVEFAAKDEGGNVVEKQLVPKGQGAVGGWRQRLRIREISEQRRQYREFIRNRVDHGKVKRRARIMEERRKQLQRRLERVRDPQQRRRLKEELGRLDRKHEILKSREKNYRENLEKQREKVREFRKNHREKIKKFREDKRENIRKRLRERSDKRGIRREKTREKRRETRSRYREKRRENARQGHRLETRKREKVQAREREKIRSRQKLKKRHQNRAQRRHHRRR